MKDNVLVQLAVSFGLGLLLGLQRERTERSIAGFRTFPLIALFGTICAHLAQGFGGWILASGLISLAGLVVWANVAKFKAGNVDPGITTEVTAVLIFALGAYIAAGHMGAAVVVGGAVALVLQYKKPMHAFAGALGERDMRAIMLFVLLTLVILPVLPRAEFGPYGVWNPFEIWLMVVLIVAISLSGYVAYKLLGAKVGTWLGGILGGLISSTATTVSYARRTVGTPQIAPLAALVIMIASCVSVARVLVEIAVVAPRFFPRLAAPLAAMLAACAAIAGALYFFSRREKTEMPELQNPAELRPALIFGGLYALVLLAVAAAKDYFGSPGLYAVGLLAGLTDMDAITLSSAKLVESGRTTVADGWRTILVAAMSNFVFKFGIVALLGHRALTLRIAIAFCLALASGGLIFVFWPTS